MPKLDPLQFLDAKAAFSEMPAQIPWIIEPWLATGTISQFVSDVKLGKTTFAKALAYAVMRGKLFLGKLATKSPAVYLTEEPTTSYLRGLRDVGIAPDDPLHTLYYTRTWGHDWSEIIAETLARVREVGAKLLIIDTLSQFAGFKDEDENKQGALTAAYKPLQMATGEGLSIIVLQHARKSGGSPSTAARGSSAGSGIVDQIFVIKSVAGDDRMRRIVIAGRFMDSHPEGGEVTIRFGEDGQFAHQGHRSTGQETIYRVLKNANGTGLAVSEIHDSTRLSKMHINNILKDWKARDAVVYEIVKRKGIPRPLKLYRLADPAAPAPVTNGPTRVMKPKKLPFTIKDILEAAAMEYSRREEED